MRELMRKLRKADQIGREWPGENGEHKVRCVSSLTQCAGLLLLRLL